MCVPLIFVISSANIIVHNNESHHHLILLKQFGCLEAMVQIVTLEMQHVVYIQNVIKDQGIIV